MTEQTTLCKAELLDSLRSSAENAVARLRKIPAAEFEKGRYEGGWNGRQILAHIASIEWTYPRLLDVAREALAPKPAETPKEETTDPPQRAPRGGIDDYNARQVEKRAQMGVTELIAEFEANRATTVAALEAADEALFSTTIREGGKQHGTAGGCRARGGHAARRRARERHRGARGVRQDQIC